jgi:predicted nucleic acid-binding protein
MDKPRFLLDSNILIGILNHKLDLLAFVDTLPDCEIYINPVVEIEVLAKEGMSVQEEAEARALLGSFKWAEIDKHRRFLAGLCLNRLINHWRIKEIFYKGFADNLYIRIIPITT